jgi:hypothetical protein
MVFGSLRGGYRRHLNAKEDGEQANEMVGWQGLEPWTNALKGLRVKCF